MSRYQEDRQQNMGQKWKLPPNGQPIGLFSGNVTATRTIIRPDDDSEQYRLHSLRPIDFFFYPQSFFEYIVLTIPFVRYGFQFTLLLK